ncbi:hypothetical protein Mgra_00005884 [Meloidogyne graminicola]|uniref:Uncharacterized protein n=1 Tax=Meloidogyne graminicola TaxID=189291 RepID=A0A8S9ZNS9_9BILA|nr:hypothetical protein Mgra_00005884 [Meloidogyne graminicola]
MLFILKILIFSSIILIFTNFSDAAINLLIVAPNLYQSHFSFHKKLALLLMEKEWVEKVNVLLPVLDRHNKNLEELAQHSSKLQLFYYYFNNKEEQINLNNQTFYNTNEVIQNTCLSFFTQTPVCLQHCLEGIMTMFGINENQQIVVDAANPIRAAYENKFLDMAKNFDWIQTMQSQQFQLGIAELYDPIAFYIFRLIGIPHIIATSCLPLQSIYYHYLGYLDKIIEKGDIPELCSTTCNRGFYYNLEANYCTHVCNGLKLFNIYEKEALENAKNKKFGLIYLSFGTLIDISSDDMNEKGIYNILNKFYLLSDSFEVLMRSGWTKYMRLLKREFNGLKNVHAKSWMNQQAILDMARNIDWIETMQAQQFQLGIAELYDPMAFYIFRLIGIPHIVATSNLPLQSIYYHYLGYLDKIIEKGDIPEVRSIKCNTNLSYDFGTKHHSHVYCGLQMFRKYISSLNVHVKKIMNQQAILVILKK